jgi:hypothetical protein
MAKTMMISDVRAIANSQDLAHLAETCSRVSLDITRPGHTIETVKAWISR